MVCLESSNLGSCLTRAKSDIMDLIMDCYWQVKAEVTVMEKVPVEGRHIHLCNHTCDDSVTHFPREALPFLPDC